MQTRYWLAGVTTAALVAAGAIAASPTLHGQTGPRASADARASATARAAAGDVHDISREVNEAIEAAFDEAGVHQTLEIDGDVRRAVDEATRAAHDAIRDLDVDVIVDDAMQGLSGLSSLGGQPRLGVSTRDVTADEAKAAGLSGITGAFVSDVNADSAAAKAGLQANDIIVTVDGETVRSARHLSRLISETPAGRALQVAYVRGTASHTVTVTPEARSFSFRMDGPGPDGPVVRRFERRIPDVRERTERRERDRFELFTPGPGGQEFFFRRGPEGQARIWTGRGRLGVVAQPLSEQLATYFGVKEGLLVSSVNENTPAAKAGIRAGDVITAVNGKPVKDTGDVMDHLQGVEGGKTVPVEITRDKKSQTVTVTIEAPSNTSGDRPVIRRPRFTA
jgi:serine protease Do